MDVSYRKLSFLAFWSLLILASALVLVQSDYDIQGLMIVTLALAIAAFFALTNISGRTERFVFAVLLAGLVAKVGASFARLYMAFDLYGGVADASGYHSAGQKIAEQIWSLDFQALAPHMNWGTDVMDLSTGIIYSLIGPTLKGAYLVYGCLAFVGGYLYFRAFREAFPQGNYKVYALLVFLYPSIVFWPNGMSKDALVFFFMGLTAYSGARLLRRMHVNSILLLVLGLLGTMVIRPYIAGILALAIAGALALRRLRGTATNPIAAVVGIALSVSLAWFFVPRALDFVGLRSLDMQTTLEYLELRQSQTFYGGSAFEAPSIMSPMGFAIGIITVLFRPFPWEAHNLQALVEALGGAAFLILVLGIIVRRLPTTIRNSISLLVHPYGVLIVLYTVMFVVAYSSISNFGILARQRAQLLPLFMMLPAFLATRPAETAERSSTL